ncbi:MAG: hypothetical protein H7A36_01920 [Chlamydiales bacterium]|nr:hypothetical protein [Chlamydiales bacterium]
MKQFAKIMLILAVICGFSTSSLYAQEYYYEPMNVEYTDSYETEYYEPAYVAGASSNHGWWSWGAALLAVGGIVGIAVSNSQTSHN